MNRRNVTTYSAEFRESSAKLAYESEQSISQKARELGIHITTLHGWVNKYYPEKKVTANEVSNDNDVSCFRSWS